MAGNVMELGIDGLGARQQWLVAEVVSGVRHAFRQDWR